MLLPTLIEEVENKISFELRRLLLLNLRKLIKDSKHYTLLFGDFQNDFTKDLRYRQLQLMQYQIVGDPHMLSVDELILENIQDSLPAKFYSDDRVGVSQDIVIDEIDELLTLTIDEIK